MIAPSAERKLYNGTLRILPFEEIESKIRDGDYQSHSFPRGFMITQISDYDNERVLDVVFLLGERFDDWKHEALERLIEFGRSHGCNAVEAISRLGLEPALKPLGFRRKRVLLRKEIT
jgi:hypothetical protein